MSHTRKIQGPLGLCLENLKNESLSTEALTVDPLRGEAGGSFNVVTFMQHNTVKAEIQYGPSIEQQDKDKDKDKDKDNNKKTPKPLLFAYSKNRIQQALSES